jgi:glucan phosphorylase
VAERVISVQNRLNAIKGKSYFLKQFSNYLYDSVHLSNKHSAVLDFSKLIKEVKRLIKKCKNEYFDEELRIELRTITQKLFDLQIKRLSAYINDRGKIKNMPKHEEDFQKEITNFTMKISKL